MTEDRHAPIRTDSVNTLGSTCDPWVRFENLTRHLSLASKAHAE